MTKAEDFLPILLIPGLNCSPRLYEAQIPALWELGQVTIANHRRDETMGAIAKRILSLAPPRFRLAGLSMGGYISLEIMRQAPERVAKLALLDTSAQPETPQQTERRMALIALAKDNRLQAINEILWPFVVHESKQNDSSLRKAFDQMAFETGSAAFIRQQKAIMARADSRSSLGSIKCSTLVIVGDSDQLTPPAHAREIADGIPHAHLETIARCGHMSTMEEPIKVTKLLVGFFAE
jgi:pimeloyl-ACP methyl ester carboxylesterase